MATRDQFLAMDILDLLELTISDPKIAESEWWADRVPKRECPGLNAIWRNGRGVYTYIETMLLYGGLRDPKHPVSRICSKTLNDELGKIVSHIRQRLTCLSDNLEPASYVSHNIPNDGPLSLQSPIVVRCSSQVFAFFHLCDFYSKRSSKPYEYFTYFVCCALREVIDNRSTVNNYRILQTAISHSIFLISHSSNFPTMKEAVVINA